MREPRVRAANGLRNLGMPPRESLDVHFVDDGLVQLPAKRSITFAVEGIVDDDGFWGVRRIVVTVALEIVSAERIGKHRLVPLDAAGNGARVGIDEELCGIAAESDCGIPGPVHPKAVTLAGADAAKVCVPAERGPLGKVDARLVSVAIEQAQLHTLGDFREDREIRALTVPCRAEREGLPGANVPGPRQGVDNRPTRYFSRAHRSPRLLTRSSSATGKSRQSSETSTVPPTIGCPVSTFVHEPCGTQIAVPCQRPSARITRRGTTVITLSPRQNPTT